MVLPDKPVDIELQSKLSIWELNGGIQDLAKAIAQFSVASEKILVGFYNAVAQFQGLLAALDETLQPAKVEKHPTNQNEEIKTGEGENQF